MRSRFRKGCYAALGLLALGANAPAADLSSPKSAFLAYTDAIAASDFEALKGLVSADDAHLKLLRGQLDYATIEKRYQEAAEKAFPGATTRPVDFSAKLRRSIESADVMTDGDAATLTTPQTLRPIRLKKIDGGWKVDLDAMYPAEMMDEVVHFRKALADVMESTTAQIAAGKYKTYDEAKSDMEVRLKMRLATPSDMGSTRPSL